MQPSLKHHKERIEELKSIKKPTKEQKAALKTLLEDPKTKELERFVKPANPVKVDKIPVDDVQQEES